MIHLTRIEFKPINHSFIKSNFGTKKSFKEYHMDKSNNNAMEEEILSGENFDDNEEAFEILASGNFILHPDQSSPE
jgi:hypothetical protein